MVGECSEHPGIAKISFTGSTATGRKIASAAAVNGKPTCMELGGKSALIVFEDASIESAVEWAMVRSWQCELGMQACICLMYVAAPDWSTGFSTPCKIVCLLAVWLLLDQWPGTGPSPACAMFCYTLCFLDRELLASAAWLDGWRRSSSTQEMYILKHHSLKCTPLQT